MDLRGTRRVDLRGGLGSRVRVLCHPVDEPVGGGGHPTSRTSDGGRT